MTNKDILEILSGRTELESLKAIAEQMGLDLNDNEELKEFLLEMRDIAYHGISSGVSGFIYVNDILDFFDKNKESIIVRLQDSDFFESLVNVKTSRYIGDLLVDSLENDGRALKEIAVWGFVEEIAGDVCDVYDEIYYEDFDEDDE